MRSLRKDNSLESQIPTLLPNADSAALALTKAMVEGQDSMEKGARLEAARVAAKYGVDSPRAKEAAELVERLVADKKHWMLEEARVARKTPEVDPEHGIVFGLILTANGERASGAAVMAVHDNEGTIARASANREGEFELRIPAAGKATVQVTSKDGKSELRPEEVFEGVGGKLMYRDYFIDTETARPKTKRKR